MIWCFGARRIQLNSRFAPLRGGGYFMFEMPDPHGTSNFYTHDDSSARFLSADS
jgi:hypothetical protein